MEVAHWAKFQSFPIAIPLEFVPVVTIILVLSEKGLKTNMSHSVNSDFEEWWKKSELFNNCPPQFALLSEGIKELVKKGWSEGYAKGWDRAIAQERFDK